MNQDIVVDLFTQMLMLTLTMAAPILGAGLVVGVVVSVFQAATQIQENAISFVAKLAAVGSALAFTAPWSIERCSQYLAAILNDLARLGPGGAG